jgi:hypothetical protein
MKCTTIEDWIRRRDPELEALILECLATRNIDESGEIVRTWEEIEKMANELPNELVEAVCRLSRGVVEVLHAHMHDADNGPQDIRTHLMHAQAHCAEQAEPNPGPDTDGLEHWKHAAARLALTCVRK